jgi:hypothetical protein
MNFLVTMSSGTTQVINATLAGCIGYRPFQTRAIRKCYPNQGSNITACLRGVKKSANNFLWKKHES